MKNFLGPAYVQGIVNDVLRVVEATFCEFRSLAKEADSWLMLRHGDPCFRGTIPGYVRRCLD